MSDCLICLDNLGKDTISCKNCNNKIHIHCVLEWYINKKTCPLCRHFTKLNKREERSLKRLKEDKARELQDKFHNFYHFIITDMYTNNRRSTYFYKKERKMLVKKFHHQYTSIYPTEVFFNILNDMVNNSVRYPSSYILNDYY